MGAIASVCPRSVGKISLVLTKTGLVFQIRFDQSFCFIQGINVCSRELFSLQLESQTSTAGVGIARHLGVD